MRCGEWTAAISAASALAVIGTLSWTFMFIAQPMADDFAVAVSTRELGAFGYAYDFYFRQSGRLAGHALAGILLGYVELTRVYPWVLVTLALVSLAGWFALLRAVLGASVSRRTAFAWAVLVQVLAFATRTAPGESLYWVTGAVMYQLCVALSFLLVARLSARGTRAPRSLEVVLLLATTLLVTSLHELAGAMLAVVLAVGAWLTRRLAVPGRGLWVACLAACVVGTLVTVAAPGTRARAEQFEHAWSVGWTLRHFPVDLWDTVLAWSTDPKLLAATVVLFLSPGFRRPRPLWIDARVPWRATAALSLGVALPSAFAAARWATGEAAVSRVVDLCQQVFLVGWLFVLFVSTRGERGLPRSELVRCVGRTLALGTLAAALLLHGNGRFALGDFVHDRPNRWKSSMEARYATLRNARVNRTLDVVVPRPPWTPRLLVRMDITEDPTHWHNAAVAQYFGLRSVALKPKLDASD